MFDIAVLFWSSDRFVGRLIQFFTGGRWTHVAVFIDHATFDSDVGGAKMVDGLTECDAIKVPVTGLSNEQETALWYYCAMAVLERWPYNYPKLFALAIVSWTKRVWNRLGWVPFDREHWGEVCSGFVDEAFMAAGIDLRPRHHSGYSSPTDIWNSSKLKMP